MINVSTIKTVGADSNSPVTFYTNGDVVSYVHDISWDFSYMEKAGVGKISIVNFSDTAEAYRKEIQLTLFTLVKSEKNRTKSYPKCSRINKYRYGLSLIVDLMGHCDWVALSSDTDWRQFKRDLSRWIRDNKIGAGPVFTILDVIKKLNQQGFCSRHASLNSLGVANVIKKSKQHVAIPIHMYQSLLSDSIYVVEKYHSYRHDISKTMSQAFKAADIVKRCPENQLKRKKYISEKCTKVISAINHSIPDFRVTLNGAEINRIMERCAIVLLTFSGVRIGELLSFTKDSYRVVNGFSVLQAETTKGNGGIPVTVTWQTHPVSKMALDLAHDMTDYLRDIYKRSVSESDYDEIIKNKKLKEIERTFIHTKPGMVKHGYVYSDLSERFNSNVRPLYTATASDVIEFDNLNPTREGELSQNGTIPKLTSHDFRRTFAVFFKRYGFGGSSGIKFQFKHQNINMSDYYTNNASLQAMSDILLDKDLLSLMEEEGIMMGVDIFDDIYNESSVLSGKSGERIANDRFRKVQEGKELYMTRNEIDMLVRNGSLSVVRLPTGGYCLNAECSRVCGVSQFSGQIKPCENIVITDKEAMRIQRQNIRLIETFREMNTGDRLNQSILLGLKQKIKMNELTLERHNLNFDHFNEDIKGLVVAGSYQ